MAQHTPGPWKWSPQRGPGCDGRPYIDSQSRTIAMLFPAQVFHDRSESPAEIEANARLIAAAPDMLAALELIARDLNIPGMPFCTLDAASAVSAAIAKAIT